MMNCVRLTMLSTIAVSAFWTAEVHAQAAADGTSATANEDIVVTAQRREERLIDVPISVSAMSSEALERAGATNVSNISNYMPNVQINQTVGNTFGPLISIRGLAPAADTSLGRDQPVGLYVDGVPIAKSTGAAFEIADLERVEVLRGPQGTLYGKNTIGGAVNLVTRKPSGEFGGSIMFGIGEHDLYNERITVDLRDHGYGERRVWRDQDQILLLRAPVRRILQEHGPLARFRPPAASSARADVLWELNDRFSARYVYDITNSKGTGSMLAISAMRVRCFPGQRVARRIIPNLRGQAQVDQRRQRERKQLPRVGPCSDSGVRCRIGALGDVMLKSITAWRKIRRAAIAISTGLRSICCGSGLITITTSSARNCRSSVMPAA